MILEADCVEAMAGMPDACVHAIVTDPPYGLGFMGREWDDLPPGVEWAAECLRVLKPGGHLLAFGGTRTWHRLACAIEDAGLEIRDTLAWLYGSGFPKSLDVSKAIDRAAGAEREVVGALQSVPNHNLPGTGARFRNPSELDGERIDVPLETAPATPEAQQWNGWGTALKPAFEPIVLARKPLAGTVAVNVLEHGCGALNVDACRIGTETNDDSRRVRHNEVTIGGNGIYRGGEAASTGGAFGRWPANVLLDPEAAALLDEQSGETISQGGSRGAGGQNGRLSPIAAMPDFQPGYGDSGGASRFFYVAKASSAERNAGLDGFKTGARPLGISQWEGQTNGSGERMGASALQRNTHPTVKPVELMRWLVRLVTPPGGIVLDPFMGSGTTGIAAQLEGFRFVGIEREPEYAAIARARIAWWAAHPEGPPAPPPAPILGQLTLA